MSAPVVVAEIVRSGVVEGHHHGSVVSLAEDGSVAWSVGYDGPVLPRSCNKPLQAVGMLHLGLDLPAELLALACASHAGEPFHVEAVREILARAGLDESALQTPPALPGDEQACRAVLRAGGDAAAVYMDCSGKHAAMLLTCVINGWDIATYLDPRHPLQRGLRATFGDLTTEPVDTVATDGCGAPLLATTLVGLATAFRSLATASTGPKRLVADAIRAHPKRVSGTHRDEPTLLGALPGAIAKAGAEACYVVALPDGRAWALKIDDGAERARPVVMAAALARDGLDRPDVRATGEHVLLGGGRPVGTVRAVI